MKKDKSNSIFSFSFLDVMACGFGALVLILLISEFNKTDEVDIQFNDFNNLSDSKNRLTSLENDLENIKSRYLIEISEANLNNNNLVNEKNEYQLNLQIIDALKDINTASAELFDQKILEINTQPIQRTASGIMIDSDYLIFIIDNSGSMILGGPWNRVVNEIKEIIMTFPKLKGFLIFNDAGKLYGTYSGNPWVEPSKKNRESAINFINNNTGLISTSNPINALKKAINNYGKKYENVGIFIIGDDIIDNSISQDIYSQINNLNRDKDGNLITRINALAFITYDSGGISSDANMRYQILMRKITRDNGGSLVILN